MAVADLNGDGKLDVATVNNTSKTVSILFGNGNGTFQPQQTFPVGYSPVSLALADLNGDGKLDIVTADNAGDVSVLFGFGDGTFQLKQSLLVGSGLYALAVADLNGDGRLDIATSSGPTNTVSVMLGGSPTTAGPSVAIANLLTIGGAVAAQTTTDKLTINPFSAVTIADANGTSPVETLTVTLDSAAKGVLSGTGGGSYNAATGVYTVTGSAAAVTTAIRGLVFTPAANRVVPGATETTTFTISVNDSLAPAVANSTTTVVTTSVNDAPTISGTKVGQLLTDVQTLRPLSSVTIADIDPGQTETVTVTLDSAGKGAVSNLSGGVYNAATGVYSISGMASVVTAAIDSLVFTPTAGRLAAGAKDTTTFTISVSDGVAPAVVNATTTALVTGAGSMAGGPGNDALSSPWAFQLGAAGGSVYRLYGATLGREPDLAGFQGWVAALTGGQSLAQITSGFINSAEFLSAYGTLNNTQFVTLLYNNVLHRSPDPAGLVGWAGMLNAGQSKESVVDGFSESAEYKGNTSAAASAYASNVVYAATFGQVYRLYGATLNRQPDGPGLQSWVNNLVAGQTLAGITSGFVNSAEFQKTYGALDNTQFVFLLYNNVLHRGPDVAGLQGWVGMLNNGQSRESVVDGFSESAEYQGNTAAAFKSFMQTSVPGWSDFIFGGAGSNTLLGGPGDDTFRFVLNAAGSDQVWGFQAWDTLNMVNFGYSSAADATGHMTQSGADVTFADRGENITFHNTTLATLSGASFTFA